MIGGGYGLLSRKHGLTVDYLHAVEVVRVNADKKVEVVYASRDSKDPEKLTMFWAHTGGGGGNFGIVTKYWFKDPPKAPTYAYLTSIAWNWDDLLKNKKAFFRLVRRYGRFMKKHSAPDSPFKNLFALMHLTHHTAKQIVLTAQFVSDEKLPVNKKGHHKWMDEFINCFRHKSLKPVPQKYSIGYHRPHTMDISSRQLTWLEATQTLNGSGPNRRGKYKSAYMKSPSPKNRSR